METKNKPKVAVQGAAPEKTNEATVKQIGKNLPAVIPVGVTLAQTVKTVEDLYSKIKHRDRLEFYTEELKSFEVKNKPEDLDDRSYYSGCKFEIKDDNNRTFQLKHPVIIKELIDFLYGRFSARKGELEAQIKLPKQAA